MFPQTKTNSLKPGVESKSTPGFFRRIAAIVYDSLLLLAVLFFSTALVLPFNSGEALTSYYYQAFLLIISFLFYGWFWTHGGQTPGLRAWKIKVLTYDRKPVTWKQSWVRYSFAIISLLTFGLGFLWILISKNKLSWHDSFSKTAVFFDRNN